MPDKIKGSARLRRSRISVIRYRWWWNRTFRWPAMRAYYRVRYGVPCGWDGTMMPKLGKGDYVSVYRRGPFLDIVNERSERGEMIRLIPYQPNHGVMVERWVDGRLEWRAHMDYAMFRDSGFGASEALPKGQSGE